MNIRLKCKLQNRRSTLDIITMTHQLTVALKVPKTKHWL